jgi:anti-sigma B factor antagonist
MEHELQQKDGVTLISVSGAIDVASSLELRNVLAEATAEPGARILLDLSAVSLIDSSGVGVLITAHRQADANDALFVLAAPAGPAARVFELTRTNKLLRIEPTVEEGLAALRQ